MGSPIDARAVEVPKQTDCDPNRKTRKARSLCPSIAYPTKFEVEASLRTRSFELQSPAASARTSERSLKGSLKSGRSSFKEDCIERIEKLWRKPFRKKSVDATETQDGCQT